MVVLWAYDSLAQREMLREEMKKDDEWKAYLTKIHPLMLSMENKLLIPTAFPRSGSTGNCSLGVSGPARAGQALPLGLQ